MNWDILLKYLNNDCTAAENREVESWLDERAENRQLLGYLQNRQTQLSQPIKKDDIHAQWVLLLDRIFEIQKQPGKAASSKGFWLMGIAASLLLFSLLGWFYLSPNHGDNAKLISLQTPADESGKLTLPDGSTVYMAPGSKLTYTTAFGSVKRELHLTGEAFFNVKHNAQKPFIIHTENKLDVTVLGTSFNIYSHKGQNTEVKVASGLVGITANKHTRYLKAGEQLVYQIPAMLITTSVVEYNDAAALENQTLYFKNDNADKIAGKLHRRYNINVAVLPTANKHHAFSGEMKDTGLDNLLKGLTYATGIHYRHINTHTIQLY